MSRFVHCASCEQTYEPMGAFGKLFCKFCGAGVSEVIKETLSDVPNIILTERGVLAAQLTQMLTEQGQAADKAKGVSEPKDEVITEKVVDTPKKG